MTDARLEELLDEFENTSKEMAGVRYTNTVSGYVAARAALVDYFEERTAEADRLRHEVAHPADAEELWTLREKSKQ